MVKMKDWSLNTRLAVVPAGLAIIFLMFFGLAVLSGSLDANNSETTVSNICHRNLERELAIGATLYRRYTDDRFEKICDQYFQKKERKNKNRKEK